jgi:hypothetical protein
MKRFASNEIENITSSSGREWTIATSAIGNKLDFLGIR